MKNAVLQGDALDILPALPAGGCQAVIADPPYFNVLAEDRDRQWPTVDAYLRWTRQWVALCMRALREDGFHSQPAAVTARELSDEALLQLPSQMSLSPGDVPGFVAPGLACDALALVFTAAFPAAAPTSASPSP